ncbi:Zinc knuckle [Popillia japonica]|uniref:Zinc knuckle n=1 Tax=Popillia japonica TaxID=7064 RepID=A0AAW1MZ59_POPJA
MNATSLFRIDTLNKDNYDTWKMQLEALLIKNEKWIYVNGECTKPVVSTDDASSQTKLDAWIKDDSKAKSDIILSISPSELKQIKGCATSRDVWLKLESIYQSKGPARKATLLKQLTLHRMEENEDIRKHVSKFFDTVDKLEEMSIEVNPDLLAIMLLYSLPSSFENFRCAIESRDELPSPEVLRIKIVEEADARAKMSDSMSQSALFVSKNVKYRHGEKYGTKTGNLGSANRKEFKFRCYVCNKVGHIAANCREKNKRYEAKNYESKENKSNKALIALYMSSNELSSEEWFIDSCASMHLTKREEWLVNKKEQELKITVADDRKLVSQSQGNVPISVLINDKIDEIQVKNAVYVPNVVTNLLSENAVYVPNVVTNLLSVSQIVSKGYTVTFNKDGGSGKY